MIIMYIYIEIGQGAWGRGPEESPRPKLLDEDGRRGED